MFLNQCIALHLRLIEMRYSVSYSQKFQLKISKSGMGSQKQAISLFLESLKNFNDFLPEFYRQFLTQRDNYSKSNLVLLPPGGVHCFIFGPIIGQFYVGSCQNYPVIGPKMTKFWEP